MWEGFWLGSRGRLLERRKVRLASQLWTNSDLWFPNCCKLGLNFAKTSDLKSVFEGECKCFTAMVLHRTKFFLHSFVLNFWVHLAAKFIMKYIRHPYKPEVGGRKGSYDMPLHWNCHSFYSSGHALQTKEQYAVQNTLPGILNWIFQIIMNGGM